MKKTLARHRKHSVSHKRSSHHKKSFLKSGAGLRHLFQMVFAGLSLLGVITTGIYVHDHYVAVVPEGVFFDGQDVSGLNRPQVVELVRSKVQLYEEQELKLVMSDAMPEGLHGSAEEVSALPAKDWGVELNISQTVERFFQMSDRYARADVMSASESDQKTVVVPALMMKDPERVLTWIHRYERDSQDASLIFKEGQWELFPEVVGLEFSDLQEAQLEEQVRSVLLSDEKEKKISITLERLPVAVKTADLSPLYDQIQAMLLPKISLVVAGETTIFSLSDHQDIIKVDTESNEIGLDQDALRSYVKDFAMTVDQPAGTVLADASETQDQVAYVGAFDKGKELDQDVLFEGLLSALQSGAPETILEAQLSEQGPTVEMAGVGALTLLAKGMSSYKLGNIPDRVFNVKFGLAKYDGLVIPSGGEFSFNQELGVVTYAAGWKPALALFGGGGVGMVPGGGLCQVSTTMYRAAILAGLPIVQRKPHSMDVSYYHEGGYGIDATIYPPIGLDLKFRNDTPGPILIHAYADDIQAHAYVEFYGLSDGRSVELKPKANFHPAGGGRYISWNWNITRPDGTIDEKLIETFYKGAH